VAKYFQNTRQGNEKISTLSGNQTYSYRIQASHILHLHT
jgi:hypothetical protein